jgi:hypothetical protein
LAEHLAVNDHVVAAGGEVAGIDVEFDLAGSHALDFDAGTAAGGWGGGGREVHFNGQFVVVGVVIEVVLVGVAVRGVRFGLRMMRSKASE